MQRRKYLDIVLGELHCRDVQISCSDAVIDLFGHRSTALANVSMKLYVEMKRKEEDNVQLLRFISATRTKLGGGFLDYDKLNPITPERMEVELDALHTRHLLVDTLKSEVEDALRRFEQSFEHKMVLTGSLAWRHFEHFNANFWNRLRLALREAEAFEELAEEWELHMGEALPKLLVEYQQQLYAEYSVERTEGKRDKLLLDRQSSSALSLLEELLKDRGDGEEKLNFRWQEGAEAMVDLLFKRYKAKRKRSIETMAADCKEFNLFEIWVKNQQERMVTLACRFPAGVLMQLFVIAQRTMTGEWLAEQCVGFDPDACDCEEAWGEDCIQMVSACVLAVITAALPALKTDLVLARWCTYAIDTLQPDIVARKDEMHGMYSHPEENNQELWTDVWYAHNLVSKLLPELDLDYVDIPDEERTSNPGSGEEDSEDDRDLEEQSQYVDVQWSAGPPLPPA
jgi:hypothetical protein